MIRREGSSSEIESLTAFYACGAFCAKKLRGNGIATSMMLRLLGGPEGGHDGTDNLPFATIQDPYGDYLPEVCV